MLRYASRNNCVTLVMRIAKKSDLANDDDEIVNNITLPVLKLLKALILYMF